MANPLQFDGKVVLIAGSAEEIGEHIAEAFLAAGAHVVVCSLTQVEKTAQGSGHQGLIRANGRRRSRANYRGS